MTANVDWIPLPSDKVAILGLPFTRGNPWQRFTADQIVNLPEAVATQSRFAAGARIRFTSDTGSLTLRVSALSPYKNHGIDMMVDGKLWTTLHCRPGDEPEQTLFEKLPSVPRLFELYLPHEQQLDLDAMAIDAGASLEAAPMPEDQKPLVVYGSSVAQGSGAQLSCMSYPAILGRHLAIDVVNFGFYGAGRGEPEVLREVLKVPAAQLIFDLGKSFGKQASTAYTAMLEQARAAQPDTPIHCITPIFCLREQYSQSFADFSNKLRDQFFDAAKGIENVSVVNGLELLGENDWEGLSNDGLHPNEVGFTRIAERLLPKLAAQL